MNTQQRYTIADQIRKWNVTNRYNINTYIYIYIYFNKMDGLHVNTNSNIQKKTEFH